MEPLCRLRISSLWVLEESLDLTVVETTSTIYYCSQMKNHSGLNTMLLMAIVCLTSLTRLLRTPKSSWEALTIKISSWCSKESRKSKLRKGTNHWHMTLSLSSLRSTRNSLRTSKLMIQTLRHLMKLTKWTETAKETKMSSQKFLLCEVRPEASRLSIQLREKRAKILNWWPMCRFWQLNGRRKRVN